MLRQRLLLTILLLPVIVFFIWQGGWLFAAGVATVLILAGIEFAGMYRREGQRPSRFLILGGVTALVLARWLTAFELTAEVLTGLILVAMSWHLLDYERGAQRSGTDFALTLTGVLYLGWLGAYLVSLRELPGGHWWVLLALPAIWLADGGAYFVGSAIGRRRMTPRLSPKKSWEGYLAGVALGTGGAAALAALYRGLGAADIGMDPTVGLAVGATVSLLAPLGDLGASMIKRELKLKDSGTLLPGHGGAFDRLDSWLWAGALAFYVVRGWMG